MKKLYATLNIISIAVVITWNYYINRTGINGNTVASLSEEYANYFTPMSYAFSIWGLIFLGLLALGFYIIRHGFVTSNGDQTLSQLGPWLIAANLLNCLWLWCWLNELTAYSVVVMLFILVSLLILMMRLGIATSTDTPSQKIRWVWRPIACYAGWITVATIANIAAYLAKNNWSALFGEITW